MENKLAAVVREVNRKEDTWDSKLSIHTQKKTEPEGRELNFTVENTVFSVIKPAQPRFFPSGSGGAPCRAVNISASLSSPPSLFLFLHKCVRISFNNFFKDQY